MKLSFASLVKIIICLLALVSALVGLAEGSRNFITPEMTYRRGLTDAQYEYLWSIGRKPSIDPTTARSWMFKSFRFQNTTNWLNIVGRTNDFAKLSYKLQDDNFKLEVTNAVLVATNAVLTTTCVRLAEEVSRQWNNYTNQIAQTIAYSNAYNIASGIAASATAKIQDEIADLEVKIVKYEEYKTKYPLLKSVWNALIQDAQNRIKVLQALTNS